MKHMIFNIRPATQEDAPQIKEVLQECFGFFDESMITQIKHGCLIAETDNKIISVGGITNSPYISEYNNAYEVLWTGTKKDYRGNHIATAILKTAINKRQDKTKPVICTCLRLKNKKINLYSIMKRLDFTILYENKRHNIYPYYTACTTCANKQDEHCECFEDVYIYYPEKTRKENQ